MSHRSNPFTAILTSTKTRALACALATTATLTPARGQADNPTLADTQSSAAQLAAHALSDPATPADTGKAETLESAAEKYLTKWTVQIEPLMAYWSPAGDIRLPARSGTGGASGGGFSNSGNLVKASTLNLDTPQFSPAGELHLSIDRFRITLSGAAYQIQRDGTPADEAFRIGSVQVDTGDELDVDFDFATVELTLGYNFYTIDFAGRTDPARQSPAAAPLLLRLYAIGGARMYSTDISVRNTANAGVAEASELFFEPIIGARAELEIYDHFVIDLQLSGGYWADSDRSASSIDVAVGFMYFPHPNVGLQVGWRQLAFNLSDGDGADEFEFRGTMAGLYTGIVIRF